MTWREHMRPLITQVLNAHEGKPEKELTAALCAAFPYNTKSFHPYKLWLDEISRQRGLKPPLGKRRYQKKETRPRDGRQKELFA